jgi:hypothetical protein
VPKHNVKNKKPFPILLQLHFFKMLDNFYEMYEEFGSCFAVYEVMINIFARASRFY